MLDNLPRLGLALVLLVGGLMVIDGQTTVGTIVAFNSYVLMLQPPFRMLGMMIMMGQRAAASAQRIYEILDTRSRRASRRTAGRAPYCAGDLRFDDVRFAYPNGTPALDGLDLRVRAGRDGGGGRRAPAPASRPSAGCWPASTTSTGGAVRVDGRDVRELRPGRAARPGRHRAGRAVPVLAVDPRQHRLRPAGRRPCDEVVAAAVAAGADEFIRDLPDGYDTVVGERGYTLSGGQRQRIAIARALLVNPPMLVLDDATSAIDVTVEQRIHEALRDADARPDHADRRAPALHHRRSPTGSC